MQWQVRYERLPIVVVADERRKGMLAHQLDGRGNIIAFELCWYVHREHSGSVIQIHSDGAGWLESRQHGWLLQKSQHNARLLAIERYWRGKIFYRSIE
jgi:hypothetical protein